MTPSLWLGLGLWLASVIVQVFIGVFGGRVKRLEESMNRANKLSSDLNSNITVFVMDVDLRLAMLEKAASIASVRRPEIRW